MIELSLKSLPFYYLNPYKSPSNSVIGNIPSCSNSEIEKRDPVLKIANRITNWSKKFLFNDFEKQVDFIGKGANLLDRGIVIIIGAVEGGVFLNHLLHLKLQKYPIVSAFPLFLKLIAFPVNAFFIGTAGIQLGAEIIYLRRVGNFLHNLHSLKESPLAQLEWVRSNYFVLNQKEIQKIQTYIDKAFPFSSMAEKGDKFDQIASKILQNKYEALKRRISPGIAEELAQQFTSITEGLKSYDLAIRDKAIEKAHILMSSMTTQAKNKVLIHVLGILAITLSLISLILFLAGGIGAPLLLTFGAISFALVTMRFIIEKGLVKKEVELLYDRMQEFQLSSENSGELSSSFIVAKSS